MTRVDQAGDDSDNESSSVSDGEREYTSFALMGMPPEIWDQILNYLWDDPPSLYASSLTCHDWKRKCARMIREAQNVELITKQDVAALVESLDHSPPLARLIVRLLVGEPIRVRGTHLLLFSTIATQLPGRFKTAHNLRLIVNGRMDASKSPPASLSLCGTFKDSIAYLDLQDIIFASFADLTRLLCSFPGLHTLRLKQLNWHQYRLTPAMSKNPRLKNLRIKNLELAAGNNTYPIDQFVEWFLTTPSVDSLRSIDLFEGSAGVHSYYKLIEHCSHSLCEMRLCFSSGLVKYLAVLSRTLFRHRFPNLRTLELLELQFSDIPTIVTTLAHIPHTVKFPKLNFDILSLYLYHPNWSTLDIAIAAQMLSKRSQGFYVEIHALVRDHKRAVIERHFNLFFPLSSAVGALVPYWE